MSNPIITQIHITIVPKNEYVSRTDYDFDFTMLSGDDGFVATQGMVNVLTDSSPRVESQLKTFNASHSYAMYLDQAMDAYRDQWERLLDKPDLKALYHTNDPKCPMLATLIKKLRSYLMSHDRQCAVVIQS